MRIGIEALRLFRKYKHGEDIAALELIRQLQIIDYNNEYFIFCFDGNDDSLLHETRNFRIIRLPLMPVAFAEQIIIPFLCIKYKLDLLHSTANTSPLISTCKQIVTIHDNNYLKDKKGTKGKTLHQKIGNIYRNIIVPAALRRANKIITASVYDSTQIAETYPKIANQLEVIPHSFGAHFTKKPDNTTINTAVRYKLPKEGFILLIGSLDPKKNLDNVLKALFLLKKQNKLSLKVVITDIAARRIYRKIKKLNLKGLESDLIITNYITNTDLPDFYNLATLFLYPSLSESFGIPLLEAMACGTPIITSNRASMPEIAGKAAIFIDPEKPDNLAKEIDKLLISKEHRDELSHAGLKQIKKFNWRKSAELHLGIYHYVVQPEIESSTLHY